MQDAARGDADDADSMFRALADPTRRRLLDRLRAENGQTLSELSRDGGMTRQGVTQHLDVLEAAGLVTTIRRGREKLHYLNPVPLHDIAERWIASFEQPDLDALRGMKHRLEREASAMDKPTLVYVTYIATTPERLWEALTDPDQTAEYWGHRNVSGWTTGARWEHRRLGDDGADVVGTIVEIDPPRRLTHTWMAPEDVEGPARQSQVTFDLEPRGDAVRLTVTHEHVPPDQQAGTTEGWIVVVSSLKSFLESGRAFSSLVGHE